MRGRRSPSRSARNRAGWFRRRSRDEGSQPRLVRPPAGKRPLDFWHGKDRQGLRLRYCRRRLRRMYVGEPANRGPGRSRSRSGSRRLGSGTPTSSFRSAGARYCSSACTTGATTASRRTRWRGRRIEVARGKVVGGSSSINAMAYVRGNRADYDRWASRMLPNWSYAHVLPYFRKSESWERGGDAYRGGDGPLATRKSRYQDPLVDCLFGNRASGRSRDQRRLQRCRTGRLCAHADDDTQWLARERGDGLSASGFVP